MIVADGSFIAAGILVDKDLLSGEGVLTADLAVYETVSAIWKHQALLHRIDDGLPYLGLLFGLMEENRIVALKPSPELTEEAYRMALRNSAPVYDTIFVALALDTGLKLKSFDERQIAILERESRAKGRLYGAK